MQMRNELKILILLFIIKSPFAIGQVDSLSMLSSLTDGLPTSVSQKEDDPNKVSDDKSSQEIDSGNKDFTDIQYGYTGGKNFTNPPKSKFSDEEVEYFGYSYFVSQPVTFAPLYNVPVPPDYLIGPDDNIKIILFGTNNANYEIRVTRDGDIFIPEIGPLFVAGITFQDLKELIRETVASELIGTQVSVTLGSLRSIDIFVLGAANKPGMYSISALSTLTNAIIKSGGIDISGSLRQIKLKRNGKTITDFDFYDLLLNGDTSNDARLMQGDVVFIEPIGKTAGIEGEVNRPGIYELKHDEGLDDLLIFAGNPRPKANLESAEIMRINSEKNIFELQSVDLNSIGENTSIKNGDVITIYPVPDKLTNAVLVNGHAQQPGFYAWKEGMKISDIFNGPEDLLEMTDLNYVLVKRKISNSQKYEFHQLDIEEVFEDSKSIENIDLFDQDVIYFLPSLLTPDSITTRIIQDKYSVDEETNQMILQDEWTSLAYLNKSLTASDEDSESIDSTMSGPNSIDNLNSADTKERYYEYSIYDYCIIPSDFASRIIMSKGLAKTDSIPIRDLNKVKTPLQLESLINSIEYEEEIEVKESSYEIAIQLTNLCRRQLIDPLLSVIKSQSNPLASKKMVKSYGNLLFPGEYPYSNNMNIKELISASGGLKDSAYLPKVEINSRKLKNEEYIFSSRDLILNENTKESISPMDEINVKEVSNQFRSVEITGEVNYPGVYPITEEETLNDLIKRAGGIKDSGSYKGAIFTREVLRKSDIKRLKEAQADLRRKILLSISQSQTSNPNQQSGAMTGVSELVKLLAFEQEDNELLGRLVIDLESMMIGNSPEIDLEDKDKIFIPRKHQMVTVVGEVNGSNSHQYKQNLIVSDYISMSGGLSSFGDTDNVYIVKIDGSTYSYSNNISGGFFRESFQVESGDTIVVPFQVEKFGALRATTEITQIVYQMALAAAAVNSF